MNKDKEKRTIKKIARVFLDPAMVINSPFLNYGFFILGMIGVWSVTENGWALFWTMVASIHVAMQKIPLDEELLELIRDKFEARVKDNNQQKDVLELRDDGDTGGDGDIRDNR